MRTRLTVTAGLATLLASVGLFPLFETAGWLGTGLVAVFVAAATGLLTRRLRLPATACLAAGLGAELVCMTVLFVPGPALLGVVPTFASMAGLWRLLGDGWRAANTYAAPVPPLPGIDLLTGAGIGLVAVTVDFLAVRLRRAAPTGLPLLAVYSVPAAVRQESASWLVFLLGAAGYLGLLVVDARERLSGWGRPVFTRRWSTNEAIRERPDSRPLSATGRRIGLTAVAIAVVVPFAVPGIQPRGMLGGGGTGGGHGLSTVTTPNPLVSLKRQLVRSDDAVVLTYRTSADVQPDYLRMYSLDRFDGEGWTHTPLRGDRNAQVAGRTLPAPPGLGAVQVRTVTTRISIDKHVRDMNVLPAPYPPTKVGIKGDWRVDMPSLMVFSLHDSAGGRTYTVSSLQPTPTYQQLQNTTPPPADITSRYLAVPGWLPDDVSELARNVTKGARTPYEKAVKLQEWFTKPGLFTYSLDPPPPRSMSALRDFLINSRTGYCEQFAASMALLARIVGVPARVGMGYTVGTRQSDGSWVVRTKDTHAWPELYFTGIGWLRFEPTPGGSGGQGSASVPDYATPALVPGAPGGGTPGSPSTPATAPTGGATPGSAATPGRRPDPEDRAGAAGTTPTGTGGGPTGGWLLVVPVLALLLAIPAGLRWLSRLRRWSRAESETAVAHAAWDELRACALDHGLPWRDGESPRAIARRLAGARALDDAAAQALARLSLAEERARYAPTPASAATLRDDVRLVTAAFAAAATKRERWRARLVPPSATAMMRRAGGGVLDAFDRLDLAMLRRRRA